VEQQRSKDDLGLDHFEGRSWRGFHHHTVGFFETTSKKDLLPSDAGVMSFVIACCPGAILPDGIRE
jgi:hypothetical protein